MVNCLIQKGVKTSLFTKNQFSSLQLAAFKVNEMFTDVNVAIDLRHVQYQYMQWLINPYKTCSMCFAHFTNPGIYFWILCCDPRFVMYSWCICRVFLCAIVIICFSLNLIYSILLNAHKGEIITVSCLVLHFPAPSVVFHFFFHCHPAGFLEYSSWSLIFWGCISGQWPNAASWGCIQSNAIFAVWFVA